MSEQTEVWRREVSSTEEELAGYRSVSTMAVLALFVALLSAVAWLHPLLWVVPWSAIFLGSWALLRMRSRPELSGGGIAKLAVSIALISAVGPPVRDLAYRQFVIYEARQYGREWFAAVMQHRPELAHQMTRDPWARLAPDADISRAYRESPEGHAMLTDYVEGPVVRAMLGLGDRAKVRFDKTMYVGTAEQKDTVLNEWSVTYDDQGKTKTFFVILTLQRQFDPSEGRGRWKVMEALPRTKFDDEPELKAALERPTAP